MQSAFVTRHRAVLVNLRIATQITPAGVLRGGGCRHRNVGVARRDKLGQKVLRADEPGRGAAGKRAMHHIRRQCIANALAIRRARRQSKEERQRLSRLHAQLAIDLRVVTCVGRSLLRAALDVAEEPRLPIEVEGDE